VHGCDIDTTRTAPASCHPQVLVRAASACQVQHMFVAGVVPACICVPLGTGMFRLGLCVVMHVYQAVRGHGRHTGCCCCCGSCMKVSFLQQMRRRPGSWQSGFSCCTTHAHLQRVLCCRCQMCLALACSQPPVVAAAPWLCCAAMRCICFVCSLLCVFVYPLYTFRRLYALLLHCDTRAKHAL
jgi:hypothetical protein